MAVIRAGQEVNVIHVAVAADALVLACAGLNRLGLGHVVTEPLDPELCLPQVGNYGLILLGVMVLLALTIVAALNMSRRRREASAQDVQLTELKVRLQTFADIFGIKELQDQLPDDDTAVHIATVQGMMRRVLFPADGVAPPTVDQYDCVVIDECHRGYTLDREMSDTEPAANGDTMYLSPTGKLGATIDAKGVVQLPTNRQASLDCYGKTLAELRSNGRVIEFQPAK